MPAVNSSTPEFRNSVVSEDMIRNIFREELNKLNLDTNIPKNFAQEKEQTTQANNSNMADQIKEAIRIEVVNKNNSTKRDYKLGLQVKFEHFYEFFNSELRTNDLLYVIDEKIAPPKGTNDQIKEKHLHSVRDILINRIDQTYHSKILSIQDPKQILNVLKEFKQCETNLTSVSIRRQLYSMEYKENESAIKFWDRFEELIRSYENIPDSTPLSDEEKRDAFYNAILPVFPEVQTLDFMLKNQTGKGLTYNGLKSFIVEAEANRANATTSKKTVSAFSAARSKRWVNERCYECDDYGHLQKDCSRKERGLKKCYECNKFGTHKAADCWQRLNKSGQGRGGKRRDEIGRYDQRLHSNNKQSFKPQSQRNQFRNYNKQRGTFNRNNRGRTNGNKSLNKWSKTNPNGGNQRQQS
ncbi:uncharacterized protein [Temnothorax longispinosus]|uniref:uncharacterized protein n=1 Tax=Temnothorax longispinosus TaxID=300112 RepID=UPI003A99E317